MDLETAWDVATTTTEVPWLERGALWLLVLVCVVTGNGGDLNVSGMWWP